MKTLSEPYATRFDSPKHAQKEEPLSTVSHLKTFFLSIHSQKLGEHYEKTNKTVVRETL